MQSREAIVVLFRLLPQNDFMLKSIPPKRVLPEKPGWPGDFGEK